MGVAFSVGGNQPRFDRNANTGGDDRSGDAAGSRASDGVSRRGVSLPRKPAAGAEGVRAYVRPQAATV